jgi:hypothetical protein
VTVVTAEPSTGRTDTDVVGVGEVDERLARLASALRRARYENRDLTPAERLALRENLLDKADGLLDVRLQFQGRP